MRILVTGANGFLGRHAVAHLATTHDVWAVVRGPWRNQQPRVHPVCIDLAAPSFEDQLPTGIDAVLSLAQSRHYRCFPDQASDMFDVNLRALFRLLEWSRRAGVRRFVHASSANVHALSQHPISENHTLAPTTFYARTKLAGEMLVQSYAEFFPATVLRLFTPYGPGQVGALIPQLIERVLGGRAVTVQGDVGLRLSPLFVSDVAGIFQTALEDSATAQPFSLFNAGGAEPTSIRALALLLGQITRRPVLFQETPGPDPLGWMADNTRLQARFGFSPQVTLTDGLRKTLHEHLAHAA